MRRRAWSVASGTRRHGLAVDSYIAGRMRSLASRVFPRTARTMRFHFVMLLIVVLVSLSMHSMANAAPRGATAEVHAGVTSHALADRR